VPRPHPPEFRRRAVELARERAKPIAQIAATWGSPSPAWRRAHPVSGRDRADAAMTNLIFDIHTMSRRSYGSPRVHDELVLGEGLRCSRKRVERLMRQAGIVGIHRRRGRGGCTRRNLDAVPSDDLVQRQFSVEGPDRLWVMDVTEHPTEEGRVYLAIVLDAWSRRVVGWSIADHIRSELVVDAVQMAIWRRRPPAGQTIAHSDHGAQYASWAFGRRLRAAGLLGSMGTVGDCFDNSVAESFFGSLQLELLDEHRWQTRHQLAQAIFEWIEAWFRYAGDPPPMRMEGRAWVRWPSPPAWWCPEVVSPAG
jgi:putative transposase